MSAVVDRARVTPIGIRMMKTKIHLIVMIELQTTGISKTEAQDKTDVTGMTAVAPVGRVGVEIGCIQIQLPTTLSSTKSC